MKCPFDLPMMTWPHITGGHFIHTNLERGLEFILLLLHSKGNILWNENLDCVSEKHVKI